MEAEGPLVQIVLNGEWLLVVAINTVCRGNNIRGKVLIGVI